MLFRSIESVPRHRKETWHDQNKRHYGVIGNAALCLSFIAAPLLYTRIAPSPNIDEITRFEFDYINFASDCLKKTDYDTTAIPDVDGFHPPGDNFEEGVLSLAPFGDKQILHLTGFDQQQHMLTPEGTEDAQLLQKLGCKPEEY